MFFTDAQNPTAAQAITQNLKGHVLLSILRLHTHLVEKSY